MPVPYHLDYCNFVTKLYLNLHFPFQSDSHISIPKKLPLLQMLQNSSKALSTFFFSQSFLLKVTSKRLILPILHQNTPVKVASDFHVTKSSGKMPILPLLHLHTALTLDHYLIFFTWLSEHLRFSFLMSFADFSLFPPKIEVYQELAFTSLSMVTQIVISPSLKALNTLFMRMTATSKSLAQDWIHTFPCLVDTATWIS